MFFCNEVCVKRDPKNRGWVRFATCDFPLVFWVEPFSKSSYKLTEPVLIITNNLVVGIYGATLSSKLIGDLPPSRFSTMQILRDAGSLPSGFSIMQIHRQWRTNSPIGMNGSGDVGRSTCQVLSKNIGRSERKCSVGGWSSSTRAQCVMLSTGSGRFSIFGKSRDTS